MRTARRPQGGVREGSGRGQGGVREESSRGRVGVREGSVGGAGHQLSLIFSHWGKTISKDYKLNNP